ncbi:MAG: PEP-CTERM sorting domain-containing protein [Capsulimonadales bacterium]|nr:PEP-CTERM sorting domain-containing protein [Capsulimonadales bacterium]
MNRRRLMTVIGVFVLAWSVPPAQAQIPALSSRAGAAYTLYLNFGGFNFNGNWGNTGLAPGSTGAFGTSDQIREIWARTAEKYSAFNVNVTTVDPAVAAGQASSDAQRQLFYDNSSRLMHTVIGSGTWFGAAGGVSYIGVAPFSYSGIGTTNGFHTNWVFTNFLANGSKFIAEATAHENGHGLNLDHQSDFQVNGNINNEYSSNGGASGNGSYAPIMGNSYGSQRGTWRTGTYSNGTVQNDVATLLSNSGFSLVDDGIGHSFATATNLPLTGTLVDSTLAQGVITPLTGQTPNAIGIDNYTKDYFRFTMGQTGEVTLTVTNGGDWLTPGVASVGATLRSRLSIFRASDLLNAFGTGVEAANTLSTTFTGVLTAGTYYARISSFGGQTSSFDGTAQYFDMGSYILSGSGILPGIGAAAPEPGTFALLGLGLIGLVRYRRRK